MNEPAADDLRIREEHKQELKTVAIITLALALLALGFGVAAMIDATATIPWWQPTAAESLKGATP